MRVLAFTLFLFGVVNISESLELKPISQAIWIRSNESGNDFPDSPPDNPIGSTEEPVAATTDESSTDKSTITLIF